MAKMMDPILPIPSILGCCSIILGSFGGAGLHATAKAAAVSNIACSCCSHRCDLKSNLGTCQDRGVLKGGGPRGMGQLEKPRVHNTSMALFSNHQGTRS